LEKAFDYRWLTLLSRPTPLQDQGQGSFNDCSTITGLKNGRVLRSDTIVSGPKCPLPPLSSIQFQIFNISIHQLKIKNSSKLDFSKVGNFVVFFSENTCNPPLGKSGFGFSPRTPWPVPDAFPIVTLVGLPLDQNHRKSPTSIFKKHLL